MWSGKALQGWQSAELMPLFHLEVISRDTLLSSLRGLEIAETTGKSKSGTTSAAIEELIIDVDGSNWHRTLRYYFSC